MNTLIIYTKDNTTTEIQTSYDNREEAYQHLPEKIKVQDIITVHLLDKNGKLLP